MDDKSQESEISKDDSGRNTEQEETDIRECVSFLTKLQLDSRSVDNPSSQQPVQEISIEERKQEQEEKPAGLYQDVSQAIGSGTADPPFGGYRETPYYEKLLCMLCADDDISAVLDAYMNFDKQRLTSIHNKAGIYLTHPQVGEILSMHTNPEPEIEGSHEATEAVDELVPVSIKDLEIGKRNDCVVLYGELCVEPFKCGRIYTLLEEVDTGNAVSLSIVSPDFLSINQSLTRKNYPAGRKISVKKPMLVRSEDGLIFINVDNPFSIETVQSLPASTDVNFTVGKDKFDKWKICANKAFYDHDWEKCVRNYTKCAVCLTKGMSEERGIVLTLYTQRWMAYMNLDRFQEALQDVEKYSHMAPNDSVAVEFKIQSLLSLGRYRNAFTFLTHSCKRFPHEQEPLTAAYRLWSAVYLDLAEPILPSAARSPSVYKPDGDFVGPVEIRMIDNGNGRGLFATENIEQGQVLAISKALAVSEKPEEDLNVLLQIVKDALPSCGEKARQIFLSHRMKDLSRFIPKMSDFITETAGDYIVRTSTEEKTWATICEKYQQLSEKAKDHEILRILKRIAFDDYSPAAMKENCKESVIFMDDPARLYYGVWLLPSFINHSCNPNAARICVGDYLRIHAATSIEAGEEISIPYFNVLLPYMCRQQSCKIFGFSCVCDRCEVELNVMKHDRKTKNLYADYLRVSMSNIESRTGQLQSLVSQVENCFKFWRGKNIERAEEVNIFEGWIRASFTPAYLAVIANRKRKHGKTAVMVETRKYEDLTLYDAGNAILATCPGSFQRVIFWERCQRLWRDRARKYEHWGLQDIRTMYEKDVKNAQRAIEEACLSVYGHSVQGIVDKLAALKLKHSDVEK